MRFYTHRPKLQSSIYILYLYIILLGINIVSDPNFLYKFTAIQTFITVEKDITSIPIKYLVSVTKFDKIVPKNEITEIKYFHNNDDLLNINCTDCERKVNEFLTTHTASVAHLSNVYVNYAASVVTQEAEFINLETNPKNGWIRQHADAEVVAELDSVIAFGHYYVYCFSHWFYDFLAPLSMMPDEIIKKSYFLLRERTDLYIKSLRVFGVKPSFCIPLTNKWVFGRDVYICVNKIPHLAHFGYSMINLSRRFENYYKLSKIKANRYCLSNRKPNFCRSFLNFDDFVAAVNKKYGAKKFEVIEDVLSLRESAILWASAKLMLMGTGSNYVKCVFMKRGSVIIIALADLKDECIGLTASSIGVYSLYFTCVGMKHFKKSNNDVINIDIALKCIDIGLRCIKEGKWPEKEVFYNCPNPKKCV